MSRVAPLLLIAVTATGCLTAENYGKNETSIFCDRAEECDKASFEQSFTSQSDCRESTYANVETLYDCEVEWCEFDADAAANCLSGQRSVDCGNWGARDWDPDCDSVFRGCDAMNLALCVAGM